ncbi:hypothetical protein H257_16668 [Aphanomyces astaci]|uniref:DDE-1 domain-containing protein n=1 Tax=Aphanomyces astaci TaxID=112090 RepID=W4FJV5_APHAT|nr:hypothetical protein H257_16668 [Aphanomyces astaci]ETV67126.1 hypothetical protein H257_16668 [Aphanomyces astaci]|eukprot:XP_009843495.1 hypothetical protein H257_16668 [Aphanomyces astaci]
MELDTPNTSRGGRRHKRVSDKIYKFKCNKKSTNLRGAGRPPVLPEPDALLQFMDARRHQERAITCTHMVNFLKQHQNTWLQDYIRRQNLLKLLRHYCVRHGYTHQQACTAKRTITDLESTRAEFAVSFHAKHATTANDCVYKVDETGIQYDMPPRYIWSKQEGTPKLSKGEKHSYRMTAVLTIRRDGAKLSILFVTKGQSGGASTRMRQYLWNALAERIDGQSLLVLDNFDSHVSKEEVDTTAEIGFDVCPLPPNATPHCQPLDV